MKRILAVASLLMFAACGEEPTVPRLEEAPPSLRLTEGMLPPPPGVSVPSFPSVITSLGGEAKLIYDQGPETGTANYCWANYTAGQNFSDSFVLADGGAVSAISIFTCVPPDYWQGEDVHIKILGGVEGPFLYEEDVVPDSWTLLSGDGSFGSFFEVRVSLSVPFLAVAGVEFRAGVSGNGSELGQYAVRYSADNRMAQYDGRTLQWEGDYLGDQMFQLFGPADPQTKDDCKEGGWERYGFRNQGQCVRFIETGKDSR